MSLGPRFAFFSFLVCLLLGCGGSSTQTGPTSPTQPAADFSISISPGTLNPVAGSSALAVTVSVSGNSAFSGQVTVAASGVPANVTVSPASFTLGAGAQQQVMISAAAGASAGSGSITFQGTSGSLSHSAALSLSVQPPAGDFALTINPGSLSLPAGSQQQVAVTIAPSNNFTGAVQVSVSGLPAGVSSGNASVSVQSGPTSGTLQFTALPTVPMEAGSVTIQAISGSISHTAMLAVSTAPYAPPASDPFTTVGGGILRGFYDAQRKLLFTTNPSLNEIEVISGTTRAVLHRVNVPQPAGIDQMPDGKTLVIGSLSQGVYLLDEDTLATTVHFVANASAPLPAMMPVIPAAMADGKVLFIAISDQAHIPEAYVYGGSLYVWDSNTLTFTPAQPDPPVGTPRFETDHLARSGDHRFAIFDQYEGTVGLYTASTGSITTINNGLGACDVAANGDGSQFAESTGGGVNFYDQNLTLQGSVPLPNPGTFPLGAPFYGMQYSPDGAKVYLQANDAAFSPMVVLNATLKSFAGYVATYFQAPAQTPQLLATSDPAHLFVSAVGGVGVVDASKPVSSIEENIGPMVSLSPDSGPLGSVIPTTFRGEFPAGTVISVGGTPASVVGGNDDTGATVPASELTGPADVVFTLTDGTIVVEPQGFAYGALPVASDTTLVPENHVSALNLYGFGLVANGAAPAVSFGGATATSIDTDGYGVANALESIGVGVPPLTSGSSITVTNANGSGTISNALSTVKATVVPAASGLSMILYDGHRNLVYGARTGGTDVAVFDPATLSWKTSMPIPGAKAGASYGFIALTPDGSKLLALDNANSMLTIFSPDNPSSGQTISVLNASIPGGGSSGVRVGATNTKAFVSIAGWYPAEIDLATLAITYRSDDFQLVNCQTVHNSPDGSQLVLGCQGNSGGGITLWNPVTDAMTSQQFGVYFTDLAISNDGTKIAAISTDPEGPDDQTIFIDGQLHLVNKVQYPDLALPMTPAITGVLFSPKGMVYLIPRLNTIDLISVVTGTMIGRIALPEPTITLTQNVDVHYGLAVDPTGQSIFALTASGITVIQLPQSVDGLSLPLWPYVRAPGKVSVLPLVRQGLGATQAYSPGLSQR